MSAQAGRKRVSNFALLFVGLSLPGAEATPLAEVGGLNLNRPYLVQVGPPVTSATALVEAGGLRGLDQWVFEQLRRLVPEA